MGQTPVSPTAGMNHQGASKCPAEEAATNAVPEMFLLGRSTVYMYPARPSSIHGSTSLKYVHAAAESPGC